MEVKKQMRALDDVLLELSKTCLQLGEDEVAAAADVHPSLRHYKWVAPSFSGAMLPVHSSVKVHPLSITWQHRCTKACLALPAVSGSHCIAGGRVRKVEQNDSANHVSMLANDMAQQLKVL